VNGFDQALIYGAFQGIFEHQFPITLGRDFAGTVDLVGDGVGTFAPGDDVFGVVLTQPLNAGAFAEYVVLPEDHHVARIPTGLDHATAALVGLAGSAATAAIEAAGVTAGETVVVVGSTGGVGAFVLPMLAARGVNTIATAAPGVETEHVRALGGATVVDRTEELAPQVKALAPAGVDAVLHMAGDPLPLAGLLRPGGRLVSLIGVAPEMFGDAPITASTAFAVPVPALLTSLAGQVAAGTIRIPVQRSYTLDGVPQALADFAGGTIGKLQVVVA
jgi:NADPH:quinone reductase-like Zn-dependent oxidoreductase